MKYWPIGPTPARYWLRCYEKPKQFSGGKRCDLCRGIHWLGGCIVKF